MAHFGRPSAGSPKPRYAPPSAQSDLGAGFVAAFVRSLGGKTPSQGRFQAGATVTDALGSIVRQVAYRSARRAGLSTTDAEDCAMDFVLRVLEQTREGTPSRAANDESSESSFAAITITGLMLRSDLPPGEAIRWLHRTTTNFALNYRRALLRRQQHEVGHDAQERETPTVPPSERVPPNRCAIVSSPVEETILARAFSRQFQDALGVSLATLTPASRFLFCRYYFEQDDLPSLVLSSGNSTAALKQSLYRARQHVRASLAQSLANPEGENENPLAKK